MIIYPAIDLREGRCVRLRQGDAERETVFGDPVEMAMRWASRGAEWLHVVNLDGALGQSGTANLRALEGIVSAVEIPVQFGGGLRDLDDIARILEMGVTRAILGTIAVKEPAVVAEAINRHGAERICVGIDARSGRVATHGWLATSEIEAIDLAVRMRELGVERIVYTDIARDGMLTGIDVSATAQLASASGLEVIASGGVASLDDIVALREHEVDGIAGVIIGMALYTDAIQLTAALECASGG